MLFPFMLAASAIGLPFMLIGGIANPRYFWIAEITAGIFSLILMGVYVAVINYDPFFKMKINGHQFLGLLVFGVPAYMAIAQGIVLQLINNNRQRKLEKEHKNN